MRSSSIISEWGGFGLRSRLIGRRKAGVVSVFIAHNREGEVRRSMARNFRGNIVRKMGLSVDAVKADRLEKKLVRQSNLVSAITAEDLRCFGGVPIAAIRGGIAGLPLTSGLHYLPFVPYGSSREASLP